MKKVITLLAILFISGCATTQVSPQNAKFAPQDRVTGLQQKNNDSAKVTIVRDSGNTREHVTQQFLLMVNLLPD